MLRPATGKAGIFVELEVNAFKVNEVGKPEKCIYHYDVAMEPEFPTQAKREIWRQVELQSQRENNHPLYGYSFAYDMQKNLYLPQPLRQMDGDNVVLNVPMARGNTTSTEVRVTIKPVGRISLDELRAFFTERGQITGNIMSAIVALNVMIRHSNSLTNQSKGASIFPEPPPRDQNNNTNSNARADIPGGLEIWRGYYSSLRFGPESLLLNIDTSVMSFIQEGNLLDVCASFLEKRGGREQLMRDGLQDRDAIRLERFLKGAKISLSRENGKTTFKVKSISRITATEFKFTNENGEEQTVADYFERKYNKRVQSRHLPCVQISKKAYVPLDFCTVELGNKFQKTLNSTQISEVLKFTTQKPRERLAAVVEGFNSLNYRNCPTAQAWNFQVEDRPLRFKARQLPCPPLLFGTPDGATRSFNSQDGTWRFDRGTTLLNPATLKGDWLVLVFQHPNSFNTDKTQNVIRMLLTSCRNLGIRIENERPKIVHVNPSTCRTPNELLGEIKKIASKKPGLIVTLVPTKTSPVYNIIKTCGDCLAGIPTQNMVIQKAQYAKPPYFAGVTLKINVKLGGRNYKLDDDLPGCQKALVMVMGADVTHPGPGSNKPSIASVVGSNERSTCGYSSTVCFQNSRQEYIDDLEKMTEELAKKFANNTNQLPQRVIFYRDGVSEGMFDEVLQKEVPSIKKAFKNITNDDKNQPKLTFIICGKRHHYRFFPVNGGDRNGNALPGTVVDVGIVHPVEYDWYLLSHNGLLGTSRPAHYSVLYDENKLTPDDLQQLTYNLCYLYPRAARSVSIAAPVYFAHLACARARAHVDSSAEDSYSNSENSENTRGREDAEASRQLAAIKERFRPVHQNLIDTLYYM